MKRASYIHILHQNRARCVTPPNQPPTTPPPVIQPWTVATNGKEEWPRDTPKVDDEGLKAVLSLDLEDCLYQFTVYFAVPLERTAQCLRSDIESPSTAPSFRDILLTDGHVLQVELRGA